MGDVREGVIAGFVATTLLTILFYAQHALSYWPQVNFITLLTVADGAPDSAAMAWVLHYVIGTVAWGGLFAVFSPHLPGPHWVRGLLFGVFTWLIMMVAFLPAAGAAMFAGGDANIVGVTLAYNLIFGVVLGETYDLLLKFTPSEVDENA